MGSAVRYPAPSKGRGKVVRRIDARGPTGVREALELIYGADLQDFAASGADGTRVDYRFAAIGRLKLVAADVTALDCTRLTRDCVQIFVPLKGVLTHCGLATGGVALQAARQAAVVVRPGEAVRQTAPHGKALVLTVPMRDLMERAACLGAPGAGPRLPETLDLRRPAAAALARNMSNVFAELASLDALGLSAALRSSYDDILLTHASSALLCDTAPAAALGKDGASPGLAERARDYIAAHASEAIDLAGLALDLGVGLRTPQLAFQRTYGTSARDFLVECRLADARGRLLAAEPSTSVTAVAIDCGFGNLSHFARRYEARYGELPSATLRDQRR